VTSRVDVCGAVVPVPWAEMEHKAGAGPDYHNGHAEAEGCDCEFEKFQTSTESDGKQNRHRWR